MAGRAGRALTIETTGPEAEPATTVCLPDRFGPHGTPRSSTSWFASTTPLPAGASPRSWLQSPRKWGQGRTPTHAAQGGRLTPNSQRKAAYMATVQQRSGDELFGPEDEHGEGKAPPLPGGSTQPAAGVSLASIVHQTDKDGRQQQQPVPQQQQQAADMKKPAASVSASSFLGRLLGRFSQLTVAEASPPTAPASSSSGTSPSPKPTTPTSQTLLGSPHPDDVGKKCLVLDLDETLVHSSFTAIDTADFVVPIKIEETWHQVYVTKRPGVDEFLQRVARQYEVVVFTASLSLYADPLLDILDVHRCVRHRLYREHCTFSQGVYIKDLGRLGRGLEQAIIVDNSPLSFLYHPQNAVACSSFIDDKGDTELDIIAAFLDDVREAPDVREHCHLWRTWQQKPRAQGGGGGGGLHPKSQQHHHGKKGKRGGGGFVQAG